MKHKTIKELANKVQKYLSDWDNVGIRIQDDLYGASIGDILYHESHDWDDGVMLDTLAGGVCAVDIERAGILDKWGGYDGNYAIILGSNSAGEGADPAEIIMRHPSILDIIEVT
jgi:hypothetical protein